MNRWELKQHKMRARIALWPGAECVTEFYRGGGVKLTRVKLFIDSRLFGKDRGWGAK